MQPDYYREKRRTILDWWENDTPTLYTKTEISKLPDRKSFISIMRWSRLSERCGDTPWLYVHGTTGVGKTRSIYLLMRRIARSTYPEEWPVIVQCGPFRNEIVDRTRPLKKGEKRQGSLKEYLDPIYDCSVLWLDEIDKLKFTERVEDEFFSLIDHRYAHSKFTIFSGPLSPAEFRKKMSAEDGPQIIRRIVQLSKVVRFATSRADKTTPAPTATVIAKCAPEERGALLSALARNPEILKSK